MRAAWQAPPGGAGAAAGAAGFVLAGVVVAALYFGLTGAEQDLVYVAFAVAAAGSVVAGVRAMPPRPRAWVLFAAGVAAVVAGELVWFWYENIRGELAPFPSAADAFYLAGYAAVAASLLAVAQAASPGQGKIALIDSLLLGVGATVAAWPVLFAPVVADPSLGPWAHAVAFAYPAADVLILVAVARLLLGPTPAPRVAPVLAAGLLATLVADVGYARLVLEGAYASGHPIDAGWIAMFACYGAAGRMLGAGSDLPTRGEGRHANRARWAVPVAGALLVPAAVALLWVRGDPVPPAVWIPAALALVALGWLRLRAQTRAAREAAVVGLVSAVAVLGALQVELFERIDEFFHRHDVEAWQIDELMAALPIVAAALAVYAWRRWREAAAEIALRRAAEERTAAALKQAEVANRAKSAFLSTMSHELRTPMNAIIGYAHLLLDGLDGDLTEAQAADVRQIAAGGDRLLRLINDVLDLSRVEAGRLELATESVDVGAALDGVRMELAPLAAAKGLTLSASSEPGLVVEADPVRLRQVLLNLAGNAVKFTDHGTVRLEARRRGRGVEIAVIDTGIGIAPEDLPHVFEEFRQADAGPSRRHQGTGLGLAIVRRLVEQHGGEVTADSTPGVGSTFRVKLPAGVAGTAPRPIAPATTHPDPRPNGSNPTTPRGG